MAVTEACLNRRRPPPPPPAPAPAPGLRSFWFRDAEHSYPVGASSAASYAPLVRVCRRGPGGDSSAPPPHSGENFSTPNRPWNRSQQVENLENSTESSQGANQASTAGRGSPGGTMESTDLTQRLPEDMLVAVLRRLPPHGLAAARCVCKAWHAVIDTRRLLDLFPPSLAGLFLNFDDLEISEFFFRPPRDTDTAVSGRLDYVPTEYDTGIMDHCNGLLLFCTYVANPATRRWAPLPEPPPGRDSCHILFDPAVSPHYEVLKIPKPPRCNAGVELQLEWPPSPFIMHVFSSTTGNWEERSFARRGDAIWNVAHLQKLAIQSMLQGHSAYWRGHLYVFNIFVMRITLSNCTYQAIQPPIDVCTTKQNSCLGRSENGVYFASIDEHRRLRVWILNELHGEIEWVLKHDNNLDHMLSRGIYDPQVQGPWRIEDINYNCDQSTSPINMKEAAEEEKFEWNSDNENTLDTRLEVGMHYTGNISILGFHPYKKVIFLNKSVSRGLAYHLNSSKLEDLGNIYPKDYTSMYMIIEQSFPYTPCWIGKLPGSI